MLLDRLLDNLALVVEPFARCDVAGGCCLRLDDLGWVTMHVVLQGEGELVTGRGRAYPLRPGTLGLVPARMPHSLRRGSGPHQTETADIDRSRADATGLLRFVAGPDGGDPASDQEDRLVVACGELQALYAHGLGLFDRLAEPVVVDLADSDEIMATVKRLLEESEQRLPGSRAMLRALMNACLVQLFRRLCEGPDCPLPWLAALEDPRMAAVLDTLLEHPEREHSVESLADVATMSRSAFAQEFRACFGRTPMAFVRELRLRRGAELLRGTELGVEAIAHRIGFDSRSHFSRAFQGLFGVSPTAFRHAGGQ